MAHIYNTALAVLWQCTFGSQFLIDHHHHHHHHHHRHHMSIFLWLFSCWTASCINRATSTVSATLSVLLSQSNLRFLITIRIFHEWFTCSYFLTQCALIILAGCTGHRRQDVASSGAQPISYKCAFDVSNLGPTFGRHMTNYSKADTQNLKQYEIWSFDVNMFVKLSWPTRVQVLRNAYDACCNVELVMCAFLCIFIEYEPKMFFFF